VVYIICTLYIALKVVTLSLRRVMQKLASSKEISLKLSIPLSTVTHYTNLGLFKMAGRRGNKRLYDENEVKSQLAKIRKMTSEGYPLRLIRDKLIA